MNFIKKALNFLIHPTHSRTATILIFVILVIAVPLTVFVSQKQQHLKQRASGQNCEADYTSCTAIYNTCSQNCSYLQQGDYKTYDAYTQDYSACTDRCSTDESKCNTDAYNVYLQCDALANSDSTPSVSPTPAPTTPSTGNCGNYNCSSNQTCIGTSFDNSTFCLPKSVGGIGAYCGTPNKTPNNDACTSDYCSSTLRCANNSPTPTPPSCAGVCGTSVCATCSDGTRICGTTDLNTCPTLTATPIPNTPTPVPSKIPIAAPTFIPTIVPTQVVSPTPGTLTPLTVPYCYLKNKGDGNCDNIINLLDFELWRTEFVGMLKGIPIINKPSDFNSDGLITIVDFNIWKTNFQDPSLQH